MARRRRSKTTKKVEVTFSDGTTKQYNLHGKSASEKSLKVSDETGKILHIQLKRLQSYEVI